jgi:hypothetical protein
MVERWKLADGRAFMAAVPTTISKTAEKWSRKVGMNR